jgi:hypothetical protein
VQVPVGIYHLNIELAGLAASARQIEIFVGQTPRIDATLKVGTLAERSTSSLMRLCWTPRVRKSHRA